MLSPWLGATTSMRINPLLQMRKLQWCSGIWQCHKARTQKDGWLWAKIHLINHLVGIFPIYGIQYEFLVRVLKNY